MQEAIDNSNRIHNEKDNEKDNEISTLQQQLNTLTQSNDDMSNNSQTISEQMVELRNALDDRNQRISHLELNLSEVAEERQLLKSEMANQTQELLNQVKNLRAQLEEVRLFETILLTLFLSHFFIFRAHFHVFLFSRICYTTLHALHCIIQLTPIVAFQWPITSSVVLAHFILPSTMRHRT